MRWVRWWAVWAVLAGSPVMAQLLMERAPPQHRLVHRITVAARLNPVGVVLDTRVSYRYRLYESSQLALRDNFVGIGLMPTVTPAHLRVGPFIEVNPTTFLGLWAGVQLVQFFGAFNNVHPLSSANADFSDAQVRQVPGTATGGWDLILGATLQLKVKSVIVRNQVRLTWPDLRLPDDAPVYFDSTFDVAVPNRGFFLR